MVDSRTRIAGAFLIGGTMVILSFIAGNKPHADANGSLAAVTVPRREHLQTADDDHDGVPNWQEALQNIDPLILSKATSTYEAPKTITGKFALQFFEDVIRSKNYGAFGESQEELITRATQELADKATDELFTKKDITTTDLQSPEVLKAYGNHIASIALSQKSGEENEAIILQDTVRYNHRERLADLDPIAASYVEMVKLMLETPVPEKYVTQHLNVLNAYNAVREDIHGMQKLYEDPLYTFIRVKRYEDDVRGMSNAVLDLFNTLYLNDNIRWGEQEPASMLVRFPG